MIEAIPYIGDEESEEEVDLEDSAEVFEPDVILNKDGEKDLFK